MTPSARSLSADLLCSGSLHQVPVGPLGQNLCARISCARSLSRSLSQHFVQWTRTTSPECSTSNSKNATLPAFRAMDTQDLRKRLPFEVRKMQLYPFSLSSWHLDGLRERPFLSGRHWRVRRSRCMVPAVLVRSAVSSAYSTSVSESKERIPSNFLPFKALRQIFGVKNPTFTGSCRPLRLTARTHTLSLSHKYLPRMLLPNQVISSRRLRYLGHILRHPDCLEHNVSFNDSHSLRTISSPFRRGAPRAHWPELALSEASHGLSFLRLHQGPASHLSTHPIFNTSTLATIKQQLGPTLPQRYDTGISFRPFYTEPTCLPTIMS